MTELRWFYCYYCCYFYYCFEFLTALHHRAASRNGRVSGRKGLARVDRRAEERWCNTNSPHFDQTVAKRGRKPHTRRYTHGWFQGRPGAAAPWQRLHRRHRKRRGGAEVAAPRWRRPWRRGAAGRPRERVGAAPGAAPPPLRWGRAPGGSSGWVARPGLPRSRGARWVGGVRPETSAALPVMLLAGTVAWLLSSQALALALLKEAEPGQASVEGCREGLCRLISGFSTHTRVVFPIRRASCRFSHWGRRACCYLG